MGHKIVDLFTLSLKFVIIVSVILLVLSRVPTEGGGSALSEAIGGIGGAIGQLDDLIRDIRGAAAA
jgi:hypothetical protein